MQRKRIVLFINRLSRGGAETQCVRLAQGLHGRGWRVRVLTLMTSTAFTDELATSGIPVSDLSAGGGVYHPGLLVRLFRELRDYQPEVLVTFLYQADLLGRVAGAILHVPARITSIRNEFFGASGRPREHWTVRVRESLIRLTDPLVQLTAANSELAADSLVKRGIVPRRRLRMIPNMIDLTPYAPLAVERRAEIRRGLGVEDDSEFIWLHAGRMEAQKDQATLLRAFARHSLNLPRTKLWIAGEGARRKELETLADELGIRALVGFLGERADMPDLLRAADGFVLSSLWEGLPNVLIEAGAARLPVVSTDVGGVREAVAQEMEGFLVAVKNVDRLANAMDRTVKRRRDDPAGCSRLAEINYQHVKRRFGRDEVLDRWEEVIRECRMQ